MAHVLENVQKESEMLKSLLQDSITPMVYDQVSNLENLLMNIERASNQLSNKRMVKLQTKANDFVLKRFRKSTRKTMSINTNNNGEDSTNTNNANNFNNNNNSISPMKGLGFKKNGLSSQQQSVGALTDAIEQAESLRYEIDRVKAGITLVNQSMDKLTDIVHVDTRCCGGICDALSSLPFISPLVTQIARKSSPRGYDQLGHENNNPIGLTDDDYSASLLESSRSPKNNLNNNYTNNNILNNSNNSASSNSHGIHSPTRLGVEGGGISNIINSNNGIKGSLGIGIKKETIGNSVGMQDIDLSETTL